MADRIALMNQGQIAQLGSPRALYEEPANRFVADFIGLMNLIEGRVAPGGLAVEGLGRVLPASHDGLPAGAPAPRWRSGRNGFACARPGPHPRATGSSAWSRASPIWGRTSFCMSISPACRGPWWPVLARVRNRCPI